MKFLSGSLDATSFVIAIFNVSTLINLYYRRLPLLPLLIEFQSPISTFTASSFTNVLFFMTHPVLLHVRQQYLFDCSDQLFYIAPTLEEVQMIVKRIDKLGYRQTLYYEIKALLEQRNLWNDEVNKYLSHMVENCPHCAATVELKQG